MRKIILLSAAVIASLSLMQCTDKPTGSSTPVDTMAVGDTVWLRVGEKIKVLPDNFEMGFERVVEESRCPTEYVCFWPGQAIIKLWIKRPGVDTPFLYSPACSVPIMPSTMKTLCPSTHLASGFR
jgi:hypothetical protein